MRMFTILGVTLTLFVGAVIALSTMGGGMLHQMCVYDEVVQYVDLARQAALKKDYKGAETLYSQAMERGKDLDPLAYEFALTQYSDYLRKRKRHKEAYAVDIELRKLQATHKTAKTVKSESI